MNNGYTENVSARVKPYTKALMLKHNIQPRAAFEKGLSSLLSEEERIRWEMMCINDNLRAAKAKVAFLEKELEDLRRKLLGLHSSEGTV